MGGLEVISHGEAEGFPSEIDPSSHPRVLQVLGAWAGGDFTWMDIDGYGRIWMDMDGYGWILVDMGGYG